MKKKAHNSEDLLAELSPAPESPAPAPAEPESPGHLEYKPFSSTEKWRVQLFELFQAEFALKPPFDKAMARFQEVVETYPRGWLIAKMLFGIIPMIIPANANVADYQPKTREQVADQLGIEKENVQAEIDALRSLWQTAATKMQDESEEQAPKETLEFNEDIFHQLGFSDAIFDVKRRDPESKEPVARTAEEKKTERNWFIKRVIDWRRMLEEPMATALVRQTLMNELYLRRLETEISMFMPGTDSFTKLQRTKKEIEETYQGQLDKLKDMFPEMNISGKTSFKACISNFKDAILEYRKDGSTRLIDRMRTASEIEVECRQSIQKPEPQYRWGMNVYHISAMAGLLDPDWRPDIPHRVLAKMDAAGRAAINAARDTMGEPMVDLENGVMPGEGSQFPELAPT